MMSFIYTTIVVGSAVEVTLSGLTVESLFPADPETATKLRRYGGATCVAQPDGETRA